MSIISIILIAFFYYYFFKFLIFLLKKIIIFIGNLIDSLYKYYNHSRKNSLYNNRSNINNNYNSYNNNRYNSYNSSISHSDNYTTITNEKNNNYNDNNNNNYYIAENSDYDNEEENIDYNNYYRPKRYVITKNELGFYKVLSEIAKELNLLVFSQVSLYNILEPRKNLDYRTHIKYFNKISSKSIDFVLVDPVDCRIRVCIELDDSTHSKSSRKKRDSFINELFKSLNINLIRLPVYNTYYKNTIKQKIEKNIEKQYY